MPNTPMPSMTPSDPNTALVALVEVLLEAVGAPFDPEKVCRVVARAEGGEALERVARIAPRVGMIAAPVRLTLDQVPRLVGPGQPVVVSAPTRSEVVAVLEADGRRVRICGASFPEGRWASTAELAEYLGLAGVHTETPCLALEPATPMNALSFPGAEPGDVSTALQRLKGLLFSEGPDINAIIIYALGAGLFTLTMPVAVQTLVNTVAFGALLQPLVVMTVLVIAGLATYGVLTALEVYVVELLQRRIIVRVAGDLAYRMPRARASAIDHTYGPEQLNRFFDVFTIHKATAQLLIDGLDLVLRAIVGLLLLAFYHPFLLAFDVVLMGCLVVVLFGLGRGGLETAIYESKKKYRLAGWLEEIVRKPMMFKSPGAIALARERTDSHMRDYLMARMDHFRVVMRQTIGALAIYALSSGALLGLGGYLVMDGQLTLGQLVASELVLTSVVTAFAKMGKHLESFYDLVAAVDKVGALFDLSVEPSGGDGVPERPSPRGSSLELAGVTMGFEGQDVLRDLNLRLEPGDRAAIVGRSASGKSLVAELVFGIRAPSAGVVRLDGLHVEDMPLSALRQRVAVARPDDIMQGTLLDNVLLGDPAVGSDTAREALELVELGHVLDRHPDGLETEILPGGRPLSEAEAARLVIARALAARPTLLVIDGLLDVQDEHARRLLLERLSSPDRPWTLLVLTRMESLARSLPRAFSLEAGETVDLSTEFR